MLQSSWIKTLRLLSPYNNSSSATFLSNSIRRLELSDLASETPVSASVVVGNDELPPAAVKQKNKKKKRKGGVKFQEAVIYLGPAGGAKKDTTQPLPTKYHPQYVEAAWQEWWEAKGYFTTVKNGESEDQKDQQLQQQQQQQQRQQQQQSPARAKFSLVLPPPNVTGNLHIGHALTVSVQDALCRWRRMCGDEVTWVPGFDHAGIATQSVVEKKLWAEEGKTRDDVGRDEFQRRVLQWKDEKGLWLFDGFPKIVKNLKQNFKTIFLNKFLGRIFVRTNLFFLFMHFRVCQ